MEQPTLEEAASQAREWRQAMTVALREAAEEAREWTAIRDRLIVDAFEAGEGSRLIADRAGMSHQGVINIRRKLERQP